MMVRPKFSSECDDPENYVGVDWFDMKYGSICAKEGPVFALVNMFLTICCTVGFIVLYGKRGDLEEEMMKKFEAE